jgi:hypothetical protein
MKDLRTRGRLILAIDLLAQAKKADVFMEEMKGLGICRDDRLVSIAERFKGKFPDNPNHWRGIVEDIRNATAIAFMLGELAREIKEDHAVLYADQVGRELLAYRLEGVDIDEKDVRFSVVTGRLAKLESRTLYDRIDVADALLRTLLQEAPQSSYSSAIKNCRDELWKADSRGMRG